MMHMPSALLLLLFTCFSSILLSSILSGENEEFRRVCYFTTYARSRPGNAQMLVKDIDASLCTQLIFGFAELHTDNRITPSDSGDSQPNGR